MTLLIGMVGNDGVLLAADTRTVEFAKNENELDTDTDTCKIVQVNQLSAAFAFCGDYLTQKVRYAICDRMKSGADFDFSDVEKSLAQAADKACNDLGPHLFADGRRRSLLVVLYGTNVSNQPQLWHVLIRTSYPAGSQPLCTAIPITTRVPEGALGNTARFLASYYQPGLPVAKLKFLAAHFILSGHRIDSTIDGLSIALFDKQGCQWIEQPEKDRLRQKSSELDEDIRAKLFA